MDKRLEVQATAIGVQHGGMACQPEVHDTACVKSNNDEDEERAKEHRSWVCSLPFLIGIQDRDCIAHCVSKNIF